MRGIIINELEIYSKAIKESKISDKPLGTLRILTKKYFDDGMDNKQIVNQLHEFMNKSYKGYKPTKWNNIINQLVKSVSKYSSFKLNNIEDIYITKDEWINITKLNNMILEKIAFIMLIYQKINIIKNPSSDGWISNCLSDMFREAKVGYTGDEQKKIVYQLYKNKYILMKNSCDSTSIKINYIDLNSENYIHINEFTNVIKYYFEFKNKDDKNICKCCGKRFKVKSNKQIYCDKCAKKIKLEQNKKSYYKIKENRKSL